MKKLYFLPLLALFLFFPLITQAYVIKSSDFIYVAKDEVVEGNLYFGSKSITIEGEVLGDVIGISPNVQVNGHVTGDLITISQNIQINGQIDGNVRALATLTSISGNVNKNINLAGESLILENSSTVGQDVLITLGNTELKGKVKGNVHGMSRNFLLLGSVDKNVDILLDKVKRKKYVSTLKISETAEIGGTLSYKSGPEAIIETENIKGEILKKDPEISRQQKFNFSSLFYSLLSLFILSIILRALFKEQLKKIKRTIIEKNIKLSGFGSLLLFATPIIILLLIISIIGLPIAIITLIIWSLILYLSKIAVAMALGDYIFRKLKKQKIHAYIRVLIGLIIVCVAVRIPYIGWIFSLLIAVLGMGTFYELILNKKNNK